MDITRNLQKWGNSSGVRLPKEVIASAKLSLNQPLRITVQGNSVVLTPVKSSSSATLDAILEGVTPAKVGGEYNWGEEVGLERYE